MDRSRFVPPLSMEGMLANASDCCSSALDPSNVGVPRSLLEDCHGVVLLSVVEAGFIFSGNVGTGVVLAHDAEAGRWSPPSAIALIGVGWGLLAGAVARDVIVVLVDEAALEALSGEGQVKLGGQLGASVGPVGRDLEGAVALSNRGRAGVTFTYSFGRGLFAGVGLEGAILASRGDENERFYGRTAGVSPRDILLGGDGGGDGGAVEIPSDAAVAVAELHRKLDLMKAGETLSPSPPPSSLPEGPEGEANSSSQQEEETFEEDGEFT